MSRGHFIAFEGGDGCGKSTQAARLAEDRGALLTHQPGGTPIGAALRALLLDPQYGEMHDRTEAMLLAADRAQHVEELVLPTLESGRDVVCDRYIGSSLAYQGYGRGLPLDQVRYLSEWATAGLWPELVVLLEVPEAVADKRMPGDRDRLEQVGVEFERRVRHGFGELARAEPERWVIVDGVGSIDEVAERGQIEFIEDFAIHVPLIVISELIGLDPETRKYMYRWSDDMMAGDGAVDDQDPRLHAAAIAFGEYAEVCQELITARRADPTDDLISVLTAAYDDGALEKEKLSGTEVDYEGLGIASMADDDLQMFLTLLLVAGNETTRNAIAGGMKVLSDFPEERARLVEKIDDSAFVDLAVDELIRFVSPVMTFMRTVTETHDYKGFTFEEGDRVFMLYQSANRDERVFDDPDQLMLDRDPNPHLAFGTGSHFCLGANLARMEVKVVFEELFRRLPDIQASEGVPIVRGASSLVLALQEMQAEFTKESECPVAH
ncbi:MAG: dTMP kinase [Acidimicrobiales bacterium]